MVDIRTDVLPLPVAQSVQDNRRPDEAGSVDGMRTVETIAAAANADLDRGVISNDVRRWFVMEGIRNPYSVAAGIAHLQKRFWTSCGTKESFEQLSHEVGAISTHVKALWEWASLETMESALSTQAFDGLVQTMIDQHPEDPEALAVRQLTSAQYFVSALTERRLSNGAVILHLWHIPPSPELAQREERTVPCVGHPALAPRPRDRVASTKSPPSPPPEQRNPLVDYFQAQLRYQVPPKIYESIHATFDSE
ncbi:MAG: hypothetical protein HYV02_06645 [Deltaproteobacteria bacterium]|nr:hypothetical protein [Deltaproteobacteria bacterium]